MANTIDKVRIIVVGDSGVGKTCLTHLIAHNESLTRPGWTVGCNIELKLHHYKEGTPHQQLFYIELFDIGGSLSHKNTRSVFYNSCNGIILVHDLTNRKSHENLREWLHEILDKEGKDTYKLGNVSNTNTTNTEGNTFDPEQFLGATQIPILVMGTKLDLIDEKRQPNMINKSGGIAEHCGAEEVWLNCRNARTLAAGTTDAVKLTRFFDRVIEKKLNSQDGSGFSGVERRKYAGHLPSPLTSPESSLLLHSPSGSPRSNILLSTRNY